MRKDNDFNKLVYPEGLTDAEKEVYAAAGMDHRVGVNEDLVDAEPYNAKKADLKHASVELIEEDGEWVRFDADKAIYDREASSIIMNPSPFSKTILVNEEFKPAEFITVTPTDANIPALTWYIISQTPTDKGPVVAITSDGVVRGVNPGTANIVGRVSSDDKPYNELNVEAEITVA